MYLDDNPDYKTIWQLAHHWANLDPEKTDISKISPAFREHTTRLIIAIRNRVISARTRRDVIFNDDSFISAIRDIPHYLKTMIFLTKGTFDKTYLDSLYVKREEVIDLCIKSYCDFPPCWVPKQLPFESRSTKEEHKNHRPASEIEDRIRCQAIASTLWEISADIHPAHMVRSKMMRQFGNGRLYSEETLKEWIKTVDPIKNRKKGPPPKNENNYKFQLIIDAQLKN